MNPEEFVDVLRVRDFGRLAFALTDDAHARFLLPHGLEEHSGREAIVSRMEDWFGTASEFELASSTAEMVGARHRLSWRFDLQRDGRPKEVIEQVAFLDSGPMGIHRLDLLCSGFEVDPDASRDPGAKHLFDAGAMGCADGLAQEFRRRLSQIPVGDSMSVVVRDPAAKEDLPALARMLGQSVTSVKAEADGRLTISVERLK